MTRSPRRRRQQSLTAADAAEIRQLLALFVHVFDNGDADSLELVFTSDGVYESVIDGRRFVEGLSALQDVTRAFQVGRLDHHTLDMVLFEDSAGVVRARSRYIATFPGNEVHNGDYYDVLSRTDGGWRISYRLSLPRIPALNHAELPDGYLEPWRPTAANRPVRPA